MGTRALFPNPDCTAEVNRSPSRPAPEGSDGCRAGGGGAAPAQHRAERGTRTRQHGGGAGTALEGAAQAGAGAEQSREPAGGLMGSVTLRSHRPRLGTSTGALSLTRAPPTGTRAVSQEIRQRCAIIELLLPARGYLWLRACNSKRYGL